MNGTDEITSGLRQTTWRKPAGSLRLAGFTLLVAVGALAIGWINRNIGREMDRLRLESEAIHAERFYLAVHLRSGIRKLNNTVLTYHLSQAREDEDTFNRDAAELKQRMQIKPDSLSTGHERELYMRLVTVYDQYLLGMQRVFADSRQNPGPASFAATYDQTRRESRPVLAVCEELLLVQRLAFERFLLDSQATLTALQRHFRISIWLLLLLTAALARLVYRGMIAPLRARLSESQSVIERQEKLAALGTLAAGVAHEIRNPLTAIKFRLFSLQSSLPPEFAKNEDATIIGSEINRLDRIVRDFLQFARPSEPASVRVPAERILMEVRDLLSGHLAKTAIQLRVEGEGTTWVLADIQQVKQALINLIQNAAENIVRNGLITLRVRQETADFPTGAHPAVVLQVADTGKGIPPEVQKRLFDPFFSTKTGGTGLGLAIAARIVEKHGGLLRYQTELQRGTQFEIVLPGIDDDANQNPNH